MRQRLPRSFASTVGSRAGITIRQPLPADDAALARLAALTGAPLSSAPLLVADVDGEVLAVAEANGATFADPFRVTTDVVELLRLRGAQLRALAA